MSTPLLAFAGVLLGAGVAAFTSVVTVLLTAKLTERRETRARLFDARRQVYVEALHVARLARRSVTEPPREDVSIAVARMSTLMIQLQLLGSLEVHRAYDELVKSLGEWHQDATVAQLGAAVSAAEVKVRDLMRRDLGNTPLSRVNLVDSRGA